MLITSQFKTVCPHCNETINVGDKVEWSKGSKAIHENCSNEINNQKEIEWNALSFRANDKIEITEDVLEYNYLQGTFGGINVPKGIKATITSNKVESIMQDGQRVEPVECMEIVRKGQEPKSKTGYFKVRLDQMKITKVAKFIP